MLFPTARPLKTSGCRTFPGRVVTKCKHPVYKNSKNITDTKTKLQNKYDSFSSTTEYRTKMILSQPCENMAVKIWLWNTKCRSGHKYNKNLKC